MPKYFFDVRVFSISDPSCSMPVVVFPNREIYSPPFKSGILVLPAIVGLTVSVLFSGSARLGCLGRGILCTLYADWHHPPLPTHDIAAALLTTLEVSAVIARLICYRALFGFACGIGYQGLQVAAQTILDPQDASIGIALIFSVQRCLDSWRRRLFTERLFFGISMFAELDSCDSQGPKYEFPKRV